MRPATICNGFFGRERLTALLGNFSSSQLKTVLRSGGVRSKLPGGLITQQKRKRTWIDRVADSIAADNDDTANEFIQQWLLNHRRQMLVDYLDSLGVVHRGGETDSGFLLSCDPAKARDCAAGLLKTYPPDEVAAYLLYIAHQQKSTVFDGWDKLPAGVKHTAEADPQAPPTADVPTADVG